MTTNSPEINFCWHVDDLNVSNKKESAMDTFVLKICNIFGNGTKFSTGKVYGYTGMYME